MEKLLLEFAVRSSLVALTAAAVLLLFRIKRAATQHAVWSGVLLIMLTLPAFIVWGPRATFSVLPARPMPAITTPPAPLASEATDTGISPEEFAISHPAPSHFVWNWAAIPIGIYFSMVCLFVLRLIFGTIAAMRVTAASCAAPVTVGWLRPRIVLPSRSAEWPQQQLDAVLSHERAHVRRRDPLLQWIALFNRAVFWFHPLAWWLERQLSRLAERACDDAVLDEGCDPGEYAHYLLEMARAVQIAGVRVGAGAMPMPGADLPRRVKDIVSGTRPRRASWRRVTALIFVSTTAVALVIAAVPSRVERTALPSVSPSLPSAASSLPDVLPLAMRKDPLPVLIAQAPPHSQPAVATTRTSFETASVKMHPPGEIPQRVNIGTVGRVGLSGGPGTTDPTLFRCNSCPLALLVREAWGLAPYELAFTDPGERYDITATVPPGTTKAEMNRMLQNLLEERFKLATHIEKKEVSGYDLFIAKGGPKFAEAVEQPPSDPDKPTFDKDGFLERPTAAPVGRLEVGTKGTVRVRGVSETSADLARRLSFLFNRPVTDRTALPGRYDYAMTIEMSALNSPGTAPPQDPNSPAPALVESPLESLVQPQLGLRLERTKTSIELLVVDHLDKVPMEN